MYQGDSAVQITGTHDFKKCPAPSYTTERQECKKYSGGFSKTGPIWETGKELRNKKL
jgi:hypothetical protein